MESSATVKRMNSSCWDQKVQRTGGGCGVPVIVSVAEGSYWDSERLPHWI